MKLQESASTVVDQYLGTRVPGDTLIQEALSTWLFENRIQKLIAHTPEVDSSHDTHAEHRSPKAIITHLTQRFDPTEGKVHTEHLLKWYQGKHFRQEDHEHIRGILKRYEHNKTTLPFKPQDFKSPNDLHQALDKHLGVTHTSDFAKSMSPQDRDAVERGSELVHNDENFEIRKLRSREHHLHPNEAAKADPHSRRAMQILGSNTSWCTTPKDSPMFERYSKGGPLYWIHDKKNNRRNVFLESDEQFVDEHNNNNYEKFDSSGELAPRFEPIRHLLHKFNYAEEKKKIGEGKDLEKIFLNHESSKLRDLALNKFDAPLIHKYLVDQPHKDTNARKSLATNPNISPETIHHALVTKPDENDHVRYNLANNNNISPDTIHHLLVTEPDKEVYVRRSLTKHKHISAETIHHALAVKPDEDFWVRNDLAELPNLSPKTIHHVLNTRPDEAPDIIKTLASHPKVSPETIHHFLVPYKPNKDFYIQSRLLNHPNMSQKTKDALGLK